MKKSPLLAAVAFAMSSQAAFAACELEPSDRVTSLPSAAGKTAEQTIGGLVTLFKPRLPDCSENEIAQAIIIANNWQVDTQLGDTPQVRGVRPKAVAPAPVAAPAAAPVPAPVSAPLSEVAPAAKPALASPEAQQLRVQKVDLERAVQSFLRSNPVKSEWTPAQTKSFDNAQTTLAEYGQKISALETRMTTVEGEVSSLKTAVAGKADLTYVDTALKGKANVGDGYTKGEIDTKLENLLAGESLPWWAKLLMGAIALLAGYAAFFRKALAPAAIDTSNFVTSTELEALASKVEVIQSRFKHSVLKTAATQKPIALKALADGAEFDYQILVDGQSVVFKGRVVQHAASGEALIKLDEFSKPVTGSNLFGELATYIENGGSLPLMRAVS
jgi:hypothetical protein